MEIKNKFISTKLVLLQWTKLMLVRNFFWIKDWSSVFNSNWDFQWTEDPRYCNRCNRRGWNLVLWCTWVKLEKKYSILFKMDSCFPPLAALSLREQKKSSTLSVRNRLSSGDKPASPVGNSAPGKIEILQDLDLYYIRQIAHNLKVKN